MKMKTVRELPLPLGKATPWLVFPSGKHKNRLNFLDISDPKKTNYVRRFGEIRNKECLASMHGWLLMKDIASKRDQCSLWNPETREVIALPSRNRKALKHLGDCDCILSSTPLNPGFMVLFYGEKSFLFWKIGDQVWTSQDYEILKDNGIKQEDDTISCIIECPRSGKLYAFTFEMGVAVVDIEHCGMLSVRLLGFEKPQLYPETLSFHRYLVESCGEILLVFIHYAGLTSSIKHVEIFKMDLTREIWTKLECLGHRMLCLSYTGSVSFSARNLGGEGNKIYIWYRKSLYAFHLQDETLSIDLRCSELRMPFFKPFWWMPRALDENPSEALRGNLNMESETTTASSSPGWMKLAPADILHSIAMQLHVPIDYNNFRLVSKAFASAIPPIKWSTGSTPYPWLMFSNRQKNRCSFLDPTRNCNCVPCYDIPEVSGAEICYSKAGWLLMCKDNFSLFFLNPFTKVTIALPDLPGYCLFQGVSFSAPPISSTCVVFTIFIWETSTVDICFLRLGDNAWTTLQFDNVVGMCPSNNNPVFYNDAFYCLGSDSYMGVFDLKELTWDTCPAPSPASCIEQNFLIESNGELLSVFVDRKGENVFVYKTNFYDWNWTSIDSLEDVVLFLSRSTSVALQATTERMKNRIYFPLSFKDKNNFLFYSLETRKWHSSSGGYSSKDTCHSKQVLHCTWIQPTLLTWNNKCS